MRILGIAGSLRRGSYNRALLRAAAELLPPGVALEECEIGDIPLYNGDLDGDEKPEPVRRLKEQIARADALLIATPEYNYSVPGVLKNAIDWASRPAYQSVLRHKPVAIMGASGGRLGTVRAQAALRQVLQSTVSYVLPQPEVLVGGARHVFDAAGRLTDESTREHVRGLVQALVEWTVRLKGSETADMSGAAQTAGVAPSALPIPVTPRRAAA